MKSRIICLILTLMVLVILAGCGCHAGQSLIYVVNSPEEVNAIITKSQEFSSITVVDVEASNDWYFVKYTVWGTITPQGEKIRNLQLATVGLPPLK